MTTPQHDGKRGRLRPNTFNTPNEHVDEAMEMLTPEEYKVLNFVVRHTWGWQVDEKAISLNTFLHGYSRFRGVGLSRATVVKCLAELSRLEFLIPVGTPGSKGQVWSVGLDPDLQALQDRYDANKSKQRAQIMPARDKRGASVYSVDQSMTQTDSGLPHRPEVVYGVDTIKAISKANSKESAASVEDRARTADTAVSPSSVEAKMDDARITETLTSTQPSSSPAPRAPKPRSAAQLANDALVTALREAWFKGRGKVVPDAVGSKDYPLYLKRAQELVEKVPTSRFQAYVEHWYAVSVAGKWPLTLNSLTSNGRIDDFLSQTAQSAPLLRQAYDPRRDPAYNTAVDK